MIPLSRPRPRSLTLFAVAFLAAAVLSCIDGLVGISVAVKSQNAFPWLSRDFLIVWHSAWLSIALIPIAMVWLSAIRFARWMVTIMAAPKLLSLLLVATQDWRMIAAFGPLALASSLLTVIAVGLLFTPASNRWFAHKGEVDPAVFE